MSQNESWGNPRAKSFKQKYIRGVKANGTKVFVHREVVDLVAAVLRSAEKAHGELPQLGSWLPVDNSQKTLLPAHYGLSIMWAEELEGHYQKFGFVRSEDKSTIEFTGTPEDADALAQKSESSRVATPAPQTSKTWYSGGPGSRTIKEGDIGDDVMCFQLAMDCPTQSGHFDKATVTYARSVNRRFGVSHDHDSVSDDTWKNLLRVGKILSRGDLGTAVRILQAALVAYDWDHTLRITGNFDRATDAAVRGLQEQLGLRVSGIVREPEWTALLRRTAQP